MHGLTLVCNIGMDSDLYALGEKRLEGHDVLAREQAGVEGEFEFHLAGLLPRLEGLCGGDRIAVGIEQCLAGGLHHEGTGDCVFGAVVLEVLAPDGVHQGGLSGGLGHVVAIGLVGLLGLDLRTLLVVEAHPHGLGHGGVALDHEGLGHQVVALVGVASELFQRVLAVRKRCQAVVNVGIGAVLAEGEPYASLGVHVGGLDAIGLEKAVVAVGVVAVLVPGRGGGDVSVAVGHDDVGLAGGGVGHLERHLQGGVCVLGHLHDLKIVADHLVEELKLAASRGRLDDRAVLADLEGLGLAVGEQVGVVGLGLLDGVGAVRQLVGCGLGGVCAGLVVPGGNDGLDDVVGLEPLVVHEYLVLGLVGNGELDTGERGARVEGVMGVAAQGLGVLQLDVGLGHLHATADDIVAARIAGEVDHLAVGLDLSLHGPVGNEISLGRSGLDHGVGAAR